MSVIVLQETLRTDIENFDLFVRGARCKASAIGMKLNIRDHAGVIGKGVDNTIMLDVPQLDSPVITARCHHSRIQRELRTSNPVLMALERLKELKLFHVPDLHQLVIGCRNQPGAVRVKRD